MNLRLFAILLSIVFTEAVCFGEEPNVVLEEVRHDIRFVAGRDGVTLKKIETSEQYTFRANRAAATANATAYYDDFINIDKATGGIVTYGSYFSDDVFFSDSKACIVTVSLKKAGAKAKALINSTYSKPEFFTGIFLPEPYDVERKIINIELPTAMAERYTFVPVNTDSTAYSRSAATHGDRTIVTYTFTNIKKLKVYSNSLSINHTAPRLRIQGHFADCDALYRYLRGYIDDTDPGAATVEAKAREITVGCTTDSARIAAITDYVHRTIRYVAVEHGELGQRPDLPSEVLRKSFGDCKGSASLLKAMLRSVGFDGRLVWTGTEHVATLWSEAPDVSSGDHMIAAVVDGDSILYIDGTASYTRAGRIPRTLWRREAMIEDGPDHCIIATIPAHGYDTEFRSDNLRLNIDSDGALLAQGEIVYSGALASSISAYEESTVPARRDELYNKLFAGALAGSHASGATLHHDIDRVTVTGTSRLSAAIKTIDGKTLVDLNPSSELSDYRIKLDDERNVPGYLGHLARRECTLSLAVPDHMDIADLPTTVEVENEWFKGSVATAGIDDGRSVERRFELYFKDTTIPLQSIKTYNADINRLVKACNAKIVLKEK